MAKKKLAGAKKEKKTIKRNEMEEKPGEGKKKKEKGERDGVGFLVSILALGTLLKLNERHVLLDARRRGAHPRSADRGRRPRSWHDRRWSHSPSVRTASDVLVVIIIVDDVFVRGDVKPAARVSDEVDVVELEDLAGAREAPVDGGEKGALEAGEFGGGEAADAGVVRVGAEGVAVGFGGEGDGGDDEAVDGQGAYREGRLARADLVYVVQDEEQAGLLCGCARCRLSSLRRIARNRREITMASAEGRWKRVIFFFLIDVCTQIG